MFGTNSTGVRICQYEMCFGCHSQIVHSCIAWCSKYPVRSCSGTQNPFQNHLHNGLEHKGLLVYGLSYSCLVCSSGIGESVVWQPACGIYTCPPLAHTRWSTCCQWCSRQQVPHPFWGNYTYHATPTSSQQTLGGWCEKRWKQQRYLGEGIRAG